MLADTNKYIHKYKYKYKQIQANTNTIAKRPDSGEKR